MTWEIRLALKTAVTHLPFRSEIIPVREGSKTQVDADMTTMLAFKFNNSFQKA